MNIGLFLGHPAHFHNLKNVAANLIKDGHHVFFVIKKKDILEKLLIDAQYSYTIIRQDRGNSKLDLVKSVLHMERKMYSFIRRNEIDLLIGSTLTFVARKLNRIPVIEMGEDDACVVPRMAKIAYPFASVILTPTTCNNGKFDNKSIKYYGYQELAYLHPNNFIPNSKILEQYQIDSTKPYFIFRFASLKAHHDNGIKGINAEIAQKLVDILKPHGRIYITSERELEPQFEPYRIHINPLDMHHVMAFASLYIGDSQTMAAEAGVLGVPFVRFNDFVGRIGYLEELENGYCLGYGIKASEPGSTNKLYQTVQDLMDMPKRQEVFQERRKLMLSEKIDYAKFLTWFIENYPESEKIMKKEPDYQFRFK